MNKSNQLLAMLDRVFGLPNKIRSTFRKHSQDFDEKTNEHVFYIECRVRGKGELKTTPILGKRKPKKKLKEQELLRQMNDRVK